MTVWKSVVGWPEYAVSDDGRVRREICGPRQKRTGELRRHKTPGGYLSVAFSRVGEPVRYFSVHRLVCEAFHGPASPLQTDVRHKDGVRTNNRASNLAWGTRAENMEDMLLHGTRRRGEDHHCSKLTAEKVAEIRRRHSAGETHAKLARKFEVSAATIRAVVTRRAWSHVYDGFEVNLAQIDLDRLAPFIDGDDIRAAIRSYVKAGGRELPGVRIFENTATVVR